MYLLKSILIFVYIQLRNEDKMKIDIYSPGKDGFDVKHCYEGWKVAYIRCGEGYDNITHLARHMLTDELFVLLEGKGTLFVGENAESIKMEKNIIYNIQKGEWHAIKVSKDALVLVIENSDTGKNNSEYMDYVL